MWAQTFDVPRDAIPAFLFEDDADYSALKVDSSAFFDSLRSSPADGTTIKTGSDVSTITDGERNLSDSLHEGLPAESGRGSAMLVGSCWCDHRGGARCACGSLTALPPLLTPLSTANVAGPSPHVGDRRATGRAFLRPLQLPPLRLEGVVWAAAPRTSPKATATTTATTTTTTCCRC